jgi:hypothetical protein
MNERSYCLPGAGPESICTLPIGGCAIRKESASACRY